LSFFFSKRRRRWRCTAQIATATTSPAVTAMQAIAATERVGEGEGDTVSGEIVDVEGTYQTALGVGHVGADVGVTQVRVWVGYVAAADARMT
jgi:hypothetical protein